MSVQQLKNYRFWVGGVPVEQGSKTGGKRKNGSVFLRDSNGKRLHPWREHIAREVQAARGDTCYDGPVRVDLIFFMPRPKYHFGTGRNADRLKPNAPFFHTVKPDIDKLERAVLDSLKMGGAYTDDALVSMVTKSKVYAHPTASPGVQISIRSIENDD
jgi:Holliday junction resolvase RusA-like endonuclease